MNLRMFKEALSIICVVTTCLLSEGFCKPVSSTDEGGQLGNTNPCHVLDLEPRSENITHNMEILTNEKLQALAGRSQGLYYEIEKIKQMITKTYDTDTIKNCIESKLPYTNISVPCKNTSVTTNQQMKACMVSTYKILEEFSSSIKSIDSTDFHSKKNLQGVLKSLTNLKTYIEQMMCELQIDLHQLGYNMSSLSQPQEQHLIILTIFMELTEKKNSKQCYDDDELNQLQVLHGIYQFLETFANITEDMKILFSVKPTLDTQQTNTADDTAATFTTTKPAFTIDLKKLMVVG